MLAMPVRRRFIEDKSWAERLLRAWMLAQRRTGGGLSQEWLAQAVSWKLKLEEPLTQSAVSRWFRGSVPRDKAYIGAIAELLQVDPGWLAFGPASQAPPPADPMQGEFLSPPDD